MIQSQIIKRSSRGVVNVTMQLLIRYGKKIALFKEKPLCMVMEFEAQ